MATKIISSLVFPDDRESGSCNQIPDSPMRTASIPSLNLSSHQPAVIRPGHQQRLTGPINESVVLRVRIAGRAGISFFARIDRSRNFVLLLLNQTLTLFHILRPLRPAAIIVLLAAV